MAGCGPSPLYSAHRSLYCPALSVCALGVWYTVLELHHLCVRAGLTIRFTSDDGGVIAYPGLQAIISTAPPVAIMSGLSGCVTVGAAPPPASRLAHPCVMHPPHVFHCVCCRVYAGTAKMRAVPRRSVETRLPQAVGAPRPPAAAAVAAWSHHGRFPPCSPLMSSAPLLRLPQAPTQRVVAGRRCCKAPAGPPSPSPSPTLTRRKGWTWCECSMAGTQHRRCWQR